MGHRIHIFGASGAGTTTLGQALAKSLGVAAFDTDAFYWLPSDPPFVSKREPSERIRLLEKEFAAHPSWVLSGSLCSWGDPLLPYFTLAVFLVLDRESRMQRLRSRESSRYGDRILPGEDLYTSYQKFMRWAESYDEAEAPLRSLDLHQRWIQTLPCPTIQLDSSRSTSEMVSEVLATIQPG